MSKIQISTPAGSVTRDMTAKEQAQRDKDVANEIVWEEARVEAAEQKATDKASGNEKLLDLGLSQAEVDALTT